ASFGPVGLFERHTHLLCDFRNSLKTILHRALATDLCLEDFPIVDAMLAWFAGVTKHDAALEFIEIDAQFDAMLAAGGEFDGGGAAESRRVVILGPPGGIDDAWFGGA